MSLGTAAVHAGWKAAVWRRAACGRTAFVEKRAADRGTLRARFRRESIVFAGFMVGFAKYDGSNWFVKKEERQMRRRRET